MKSRAKLVFRVHDNIRGKPMAGVYRIIVDRGSEELEHFYVGSSAHLLHRRNEHFRDLEKNQHFNQALQNSYNKYGPDKIHFQIELICSPDRDLLHFYEQLFVDALKNDKTCLYNIRLECVSSRLGVKDTEETRQKKVASRKGKKQNLSEEQRAALRERAKHTIGSLESIEKMRQTLTGRTLSPEHCANISKGLSGIERTPEFCEKQRKRMLGRIVSPEESAKMVATRRANGTYVLSQEQIDGLHQARKKKCTERGFWSPPETYSKGWETRRKNGYIAKKDKNGRFC